MRIRPETEADLVGALRVKGVELISLVAEIEAGALQGASGLIRYDEAFFSV